MVAAFAISIPVATASHGPPPWTGGLGTVTPIEAQAAAIASEFVGHSVSVICNSDADWAIIGLSEGFDPTRVWGFVPFQYSYWTGWTPATYTHLAPYACTHLDEFYAASAKRDFTKNCLVGYDTEEYEETYRVRVKKRVRRKGKWVARHVWVTRTRTLTEQIPLYGECPDYLDKLFAIQTLAHEMMHLYGVRDEAKAECYGLQWLNWVAWKLGADGSLAREFATDYYQRYYLVQPPSTEYFSPECRDGGALDLSATNPWP